MNVVCDVDINVTYIFQKLDPSTDKQSILSFINMYTDHKMSQVTVRDFIRVELNFPG